jgi:DNA-binding response OmpR family regulator
MTVAGPMAATTEVNPPRLPSMPSEDGARMPHTVHRVETRTVVVYSDDATVRERVRLALGRRPAPDLPELRYIECATQYAVLEAADHENVDLFILDGEAVPAGGMGLCRQLKDEIYRCPPVIVLIARRDDGWLATWSRADATVLHPVDGVRLTPVVVDLLRRRS